MSVMPEHTDPQAALDKRRNRVTDPALQNSFLDGVNEGRPEDDAIGRQDEPAWAVIITGTPADDGTHTPVQKIGEVLALVQRALVNGGSVQVLSVEVVAVIADADDDIIDADVIDE